MRDLDAVFDDIDEDIWRLYMDKCKYSIYIRVDNRTTGFGKYEGSLLETLGEELV